MSNADGMANSVDPDLGAVWSGYALFAQAYLSENLGSLRYDGVPESHVEQLQKLNEVFTWKFQPTTFFYGNYLIVYLLVCGQSRKPHKLEFLFSFLTAFCHVFFSLC